MKIENLADTIFQFTEQQTISQPFNNDFFNHFMQISNIVIDSNNTHEFLSSFRGHICSIRAHENFTKTMFEEITRKWYMLCYLTTLEIHSCEQLDSFIGISNLSHLTKLTLRRCNDIKSGVYEIGALTKLEYLEIVPVELSSLKLFSLLTNLIDLRLWSNVPNLDGISTMTKLRKLNLYGCHQLTSIKDLSNTTSLTELDLSRCAQLVGIDGLEKSTSLQSLKLKGCRRITSLRGLPISTRLTLLDLGGCSNLTDISFLSNTTNLLHLDLSDVCDVSDISVLATITNLKTLNLRNCFNIKGLDTVSRLTCLTKLNLGNLNVLNNLDIISKATNL